MTIQDNGTRDQYIATSGQTVFPYTFEIFVKSDVKVEQNGVVIAEGTDYTVSGVGVDAGGNITLLVGATTGDILTIYRDMTLERATDYQQTGDFLAAEVNDDIDRVWAALQQNITTSTLAVRAAINDSALNSSNTELANIATRGGKALGFAADGTLEYLSFGTAGGDFVQTATTATMTGLSGVSVGDVFVTAGFSTGNGGGGTYDAVLTSSITPNTYNIIVGVADPLISFVLRVKNKTAAPQQWGCKVDGSTNDSAAFLDLLNSDLVEEIHGAGTLAISSAISGTLTTSKKLTGDLTIKWTGSGSAGVIITIDCAGFDFIYNIKSDGNNLISGGWLIENSTAMSGDLPTCRFHGKTTNFRATIATAFNSNAYIRGSFDIVDISKGSHSNTTRAASLSAATQTIVVDKKSASLYPRTVKHHNNLYFGIGSDDVGAADIDTDYFVCTLPDPTNFPNGDGTNGYPDVDVESYGNTYINPIGRSEKFQCVPNTHDNVVIRDGDNGSRTMNGASIDFNLQWGVGECRNQVVYLKGDVTSAITTGYIPVSYFQGTDYGERRGAVGCSDITVYNQIDSALLDNIDNLVSLQTNVTSAAKPFGIVDIKNVTAVGGTVDHALIMSYLASGKGSVNVDNVEADFNFNPIAIQSACPDTRLVTKNITNLNATDRVMVNDEGGGARAFTGTCFGYNYIGIDQTYEFGATAGVTPEGAGLALTDQLSSQNSGGALTVQSKFMADDEVYTFNVRGFIKGNHIISVNVSFGTSTAQAIYACQGVSAALVAMSSNTLSSFATGTGSNPDTDGLMNLWVDANGALNAKNRLGSSRAVTISFLG